MMNCLIKLKPRTIGHLTVVLTFLIIAGCGSSSTPTDDSASEGKTDTETVTESNSDSDMISGSSSLEGKAITELPSPKATTPSSPATAALVKNTQAEARVAQLETGRYDPFSGVIARRTTPPAQQPVPAPASAIPTAPTRPSPVLPQPAATQPASIPVVAANPVNPPQALGTLPSVLVPSQPTPTETTPIASRIEISGVVQVDNKTVVIVSVPNEATSRYVSEGELLANGQVRVKRIEAAPNQEPLVILEQDGQEFSRTVGSSSNSLS